jgi:hypothetical protein
MTLEGLPVIELTLPPPPTPKDTECTNQSQTPASSS